MNNPPFVPPLFDLSLFTAPSTSARRAGSSIDTLPDLVKLAIVEIQDLYLELQKPFILGYSGGKDSTAVVQLVWYALKALPPEQLIHPVHIISTDTQVENPYVVAFSDASLSRMSEAAAQSLVPIHPHRLYPALEDSYWVNLIGKGYAAPRQTFRWCTDRLKIKPSNKFILQQVDAAGEVLLVLGSRKSESTSRARILEKYERSRVRDRVTPHGTLKGALVYTPIVEWSTDHVWTYLLQVPNPWGFSNRDLLTMYRGASDDTECPLVVDTDGGGTGGPSSPCGNSRFGCWTCTLVDADRSMTNMISNDPDREWMEPLLDLRNLLDLENDRYRRDWRRSSLDVKVDWRNDRKEKVLDYVPGPYLREWRERFLRILLEAQVRVSNEAPPAMRSVRLVQHAELCAIRRLWVLRKGEWDDTLPTIYKEVTGDDFYDPDPPVTPGLDARLWATLKSSCCDDPMLLELLARALLLEVQRRTDSDRPTRSPLRELEKLFVHCPLDRANALDVASQRFLDREKKKLAKSKEPQQTVLFEVPVRKKFESATELTETNRPD